jgi:hypothetical protein
LTNNFNANNLKFDVSIKGTAYEIDLTGAPNNWKQTSKRDATRSRRILHELPANIRNHPTRASTRIKATPSFTLNKSPFSNSPNFNATPSQNSSTPNADLMHKIKGVLAHKIDDNYNISFGDACIATVICVMFVMLRDVPILAIAMAIVIWLVYQHGFS